MKEKRRVFFIFFVVVFSLVNVNCTNPLMEQILEPRTVTFDSNGGSYVPSQKLLKGKTVKRPEDPQKTRYDFDGWYLDNYSFDFEWDFGRIPNLDITLYARWNENDVDNPLPGEITVTFNKNGGDTEARPSSRNVEPGSLVAEPAPPARTGHTFAGWYREEACENRWYFETDTVTAFTTLYAKWTPIPGVETRTVTFDKNGGGTEASPRSRTVVYGGLTTAPETPPARTGHTFGGWYKEPGCITEWDFAADTVTDDIIIYAKWEINRYTVTFASDGGTPEPAQQTVDYGGKVSEPGAMTLAGYTFGGWYKEADCINIWNFAGDTVTGDITIYAKWYVTVTFDSDSGSPVPSQTVKKGQKVERPADPTKTGNVFDVWYQKLGLIDINWDFNRAPEEDITLYAKWADANETTDGKDAPFKVYDVATLLEVGRGRNNWTLDANYELIADIDLSNAGNWTPIGQFTSGFTGTFNGNGYTITGLNISVGEGNAWQGMFEAIGLGGEVKNLKLADCNIGIGPSNGAGGVAATNKGTVSSCSVSGDFYGKGLIGGIVGDNDGIVQNCYSTATVRGGADDCIGGVVGRNQGTVQNCYSTGNVEGNDSVGGVVGGNTGTVQSCYSTGNVEGRNNIGGVVGGNTGTVQSCYSTGNVKGSENVGGVVGESGEYQNPGTVQNCYSTGNVEGNNYVGGVAGKNRYGSTVSNCYATGEVNGSSGNIGGMVGQNDGSIVGSCVALNPSVRGSSSVQRVVGATMGGPIGNSYARIDMTITPPSTDSTDKATNGKDGADISSEQYATEGWWRNDSNWNINNPASTWDFTTIWVWDSAARLPKLRNVGVQ